jgi:hypothetical protein
MTTIFCSKKLEKFFGKTETYLEPDYANKFGNWNGNIFFVQGKKYIIFSNNITSYSFVWGCIKKADVKNFDTLFKDSLIKQLYHDIKINERQEVEIRTSLADIRLTKTNNNKRVIGLMNEAVYVAKLFLFNNGGAGSISDLKLGYGLNNQFIKTKGVGSNFKYDVPKELMLKLLSK